MANNFNKGNDYSLDEQLIFASFMSYQLEKAAIPFAVNSDTKFYDRETNQWIAEQEAILSEILRPKYPQNDSNNSAPVITGTPASTVPADEVYDFIPDVSDAEDDVLIFAVLNKPEWMSFDAKSGRLSGIPAKTDIGTYADIQIIVSDRKDGISALQTFSVTVEPSLLDAALETADASQITASGILAASQTSITENRELLLPAKALLFNLNNDGSTKTDATSLSAIDWDPTHDAATFRSSYGMNTPILFTNSVTDTSKTVYSKEIGIIGETLDSNAKYMVLGSNPMRNHYRNTNSLNEAMHQLMENSLAWLTGREDLKTAAFNVVIAQAANNYYFPDEKAIRGWLDERFSNQAKYNSAGSCDNQLLESCLQTQSPDLLIISQYMTDASNPTEIADTVNSAMQQGIPVLYMHYDGGITELGKHLLPLFHVEYEWDNYWKKLQLHQFNPATRIHEIPENIQSIKLMLEHLAAVNYAFDWSACDKENCAAVPGLESDFLQGATAVRSILQALEKANIDMFNRQGYRLQKLLVLLGDKYRQQVSFPMDKLTTPDSQFLKSYFADHAVYSLREINPAQPDMGNFSRSDFSHITPTSKTISLISRENFSATGVYALPGQTFSVTRHDSNAVNTHVFINTLRSGSTHQFAENGYKRPKFLQSTHFPIAPGETLRITSPYGGPIQIGFDSNDVSVEFSFSQIGEHPFWNGPEDDLTFSKQLADGDYDWAELVTPAFQVHSTLEKMRASLSKPEWGNAQALAAATMHYTHNFPHVLAGFKGDGVDVIPEIHDFATANGYQIETLDKVKHMNADQATCGYGCSGNPYDAYWAFNPIGHGDIHELGHGLEKSRLRFTGWAVHTMTNPYSYYTKSRYFQETGGEPDCQSLPFESGFNALQASVNQTDAKAYIKANLWDTMGWSEGAAMFIQMMMSAQDNSELINGWHLLARLHIMEREFNRASSGTDAEWDQKRNSLGFSQFTKTDAKALNSNDWLLIAVSFATGRDHRDYFDMWALEYTEPAAAQVTSFAYPAIPRNYYISSAQGYCKGEGFDGNKLSIDGVHPWP